VTLLSNAVEVLEQRQITQKKISLIVEEEQDYLLIHIEDNAGGIAPAIQETLFEPYISMKEHTTGKGLGLYIAKIIIEDNMQGLLSVKQGLKGARFTVEIKREL
jgi:C4-dicarboxylate-specific signal transduction histidine kinase